MKKNKYNYTPNLWQFVYIYVLQQKWWVIYLTLEPVALLHKAKALFVINNQFSHNIVIRLCNIKTGATHMSAYDIEEMLMVSLEDLNIHIDTIIEELKNK